MRVGLGLFIEPSFGHGYEQRKAYQSVYRLYFNYDGAYASLATEDRFSHLKLGAAYKHVFKMQSDANLNDLYRFDTQINVFITVF